MTAPIAPRPGIETRPLAADLCSQLMVLWHLQGYLELELSALRIKAAPPGGLGDSEVRLASDHLLLELATFAAFIVRRLEAARGTR